MTRCAADMEPECWCGGLATTARHGETAPVKSELRQPATVPPDQPHHGGLDCCERLRDRNETRKDWRERNETVPVHRWFVRKGDPRIDGQLSRIEETSARFPEVRSILRQLSTKGPCSSVYQQKIKQHHCCRPTVPAQWAFRGQGQTCSFLPRALCRGTGCKQAQERMLGFTDTWRKVSESAVRRACLLPRLVKRTVKRRLRRVPFSRSRDGALGTVPSPLASPAGSPAGPPRGSPEPHSEEQGQSRSGTLVTPSPMETGPQCPKSTRLVAQAHNTGAVQMSLSWCLCPSGPWGSRASQRHAEVCCKELTADSRGGWGHQDPERSGGRPGGWTCSHSGSCRAGGCSA